LYEVISRKGALKTDIQSVSGKGVLTCYLMVHIEPENLNKALK